MAQQLGAGGGGIGAAPPPGAVGGGGIGVAPVPPVAAHGGGGVGAVAQGGLLQTYDIPTALTVGGPPKKSDESFEIWGKIF